MKQIIFYLGKVKKKIIFDPKYAKELDEGYEILIPKGDTATRHYIPKKDISDIIDYKESMIKKKRKLVSSITGY
jgi:hypothetical protein